MREDDQRRLTRAALLHDVGKAFIPVPILEKIGVLTDEENAVLAQHTQLGYNALKEQRGFPGEVLDVVLHHHEMLDGTGYPKGLEGDRISDIVRIITLVDTYATLLEPDAETSAMTPEQAYGIMELMGGKLDGALRQAFRPVALGT
jgi:HD-GYP domain-containing protein (c-di-GMP phosphodiesterase class II)